MRRRGGRVLTPVLLVAGSLLTALALLAGWAQWQLLDTGAWGDTSERLLDRPEIRDRVAEYVVDEVRRASGGSLPREAGPGLERRVAAELDGARPGRVWRSATTEAHRDLVRVVEDDGAARGDGVTLDLQRLIRAVAVELGLPLPATPEGAGEVTIVSGGQARGAREGAAQLERTATVLLIGGPLVLLLAVLAAAGWRMRALSGAGLAVAAAGAIVLAARALVGAGVVETLAPARSDREAAEAVWSVGTSMLGAMAWVAIVGGLALAVAAVVAAARAPRERLPRSGWG